MAIDPLTVSGMAGAAVFVLSYFGNLQGWLPSTDWRFPATNLLGALLILVSFYDAWNLPSVVIESFWTVISLYGVIRNLRRRARL